MSTEPTIKEIGGYFRKNKESIIGIGLTLGAGIGVSLGVAFGAATDNIGWWISMGVAFGAGVGLVIGLLLYAALSAQETE